MQESDFEGLRRACLDAGAVFVYGRASGTLKVRGQRGAKGAALAARLRAAGTEFRGWLEREWIAPMEEVEADE